MSTITSNNSDDLGTFLRTPYKRLTKNDKRQWDNTKITQTKERKKLYLFFKVRRVKSLAYQIKTLMEPHLFKIQWFGLKFILQWINDWKKT